MQIFSPIAPATGSYSCGASQTGDDDGTERSYRGNKNLPVFIVERVDNFSAANEIAR